MRILTVTLIALLLSSCTGKMPVGEAEFPKTKREREVERVGKITGEGIILNQKGSKTQHSDCITVNNYLWRATLDIFHTIPFSQVDPFGGVFLSEWYKLKPDAKERYKVNIFILSPELRADAVRVAVFKQKLDSGDNWQDTTVNKNITQELEERILLKAREIKFRDKNK